VAVSSAVAVMSASIVGNIAAPLRFCVSSDLSLLLAKQMHLYYNCETMHKYLLPGGLVLFLLLGSGCARASRQADSAAVEITMTAIPFPPYIGESRLIIQVADEMGNPIDDAYLKIKGDMTHAGMEPVLAEVNGGGANGVYEIPFAWTMAGDWVVTVDLQLPDGTKAQKRFDMAVLFEAEDACEEHEPES
jgi:hypothetical protein